MSVYTHKNRVALYKEIVAAFGMFKHRTQDPNGWANGANAPGNISVKDALVIYQEIYDRIVPIHFQKAPKSNKALANQVAWATTTQKDITNGSEPTRRKNRLAAYEAGFMTMSDILYLEQIEQSK